MSGIDNLRRSHFLFRQSRLGRHHFLYSTLWICKETASSIKIVWLTPDRNPKIASLASRLIEPNNPQAHNRNQSDDDLDDDEAIFAQLEAEIEDDTSSAMREQGLEVLRRE